MKYVFVGLSVCLSVMVFTKGKPLVQHSIDETECTKFGFCAGRSDGFCRWFDHTCDMDGINCILEEEWRKWFQLYDDSECTNARKPNQVAICKSSCPVGKCSSTQPVCGVINGNCKVYANLCVLRREICADPSQRDLFRGTMARCTNAGLIKPGDSGKC